MVDAVERRGQVRVEYPRTRRVVPVQRGVDGADRVVTATAGPEAVGLRLEPCLPLGFQRGANHRLQTAVHDHGNAEWARFPLPFGMNTRLTGWRSTSPGGAAPSRPMRPLHREQHHLTVDSRRRASSIDLRDPPHAQQRVRPGPEHQLLQIADLFEVPCLRCREDSLPQTPYVLLDRPPVDRRPVASDRPPVRSPRRQCPPRPRRGDQLRRHGVQLALRFRCHRSVHVFAGSPGPRRHPFGSGQRPYPASYPRATWRRTSHALSVSRCLSAAGVRFLGHPVPAGELRLPHGRPTGRRPPGPQRGFHVPHERDTTGVGAPFTPRRRCPPGRQ